MTDVRNDVDLNVFIGSAMIQCKTLVRLTVVVRLVSTSFTVVLADFLGLNNTSLSSLHICVHLSTDCFSDFNEIWYVGRGQ